MVSNQFIKSNVEAIPCHIKCCNTNQYMIHCIENNFDNLQTFFEFHVFARSEFTSH